MIRKLASGEYRLYSRKKNPKTGKRRNLGTFSNRAAAEKHERGRPSDREAGRDERTAMRLPSRRASRRRRIDYRCSSRREGSACNSACTSTATIRGETRWPGHASGMSACSDQSRPKSQCRARRPAPAMARRGGPPTQRNITYQLRKRTHWRAPLQKEILHEIDAEIRMVARK